MFHRFTRAAGAVVLTALAGASLFFSAACANPSAPSTPVEFTIVDLRVGSGAAASTGSTVSVNYVGWLYDGEDPEKKGEQFDASKEGRPFVFWLGASQVIQGWEQGVVGMQVGGLRRLIVPSTLGYGRSGAGQTIPPNASLVFEIELLSVF
jgi:FKBP-type peptidyl-prolyl cis-trans isomerase FkpA